MRTAVLALAAGVAGVLGPKNALAADPASGAALARAWCSGCHATDRARMAGDAAPPFREIATRADISRPRLRVWLSTPHAGMPDLHLSRPDIDALIDYLQSLRR